MGYLTVIMGCMFSQKTTELLRRIRRYESIGFRVLVINHSSDNRHGYQVICSHDTSTHNAKFLSSLSEIDLLVRSEDFDVIAIDEGQFFPDLFKYVSAWADSTKMEIIVSGLSGDSERNPFGDILRLIPMAEEVCHLTAYCGICSDGTLASFSKYTAGNKEQQVVVGGKEMYIPVCRKHYLT